MAHTALRAMSPESLERRVRIIEATGAGVGWVDGDGGTAGRINFADRMGISWNFIMRRSIISRQNTSARR
ncbi:hypothetical protein GCM10025857_10550 [Alicyclobacillus contaminans]|nr:hypothetical protein GCM10025857_10550 [Alicyclobacillus contaminans]